LTKAFSDNSSAADKKDVEMFRQDAWDKATEYKNRLIDYLNDNVDTFTLYGNCTVGKSNSTGIFLG
jgi:RecA-family ATPase